MPSAHYVHPEFGYFCPTPRFRRRLRVALACMVVGAIGVAVLRAGPDFSSAHSPASGSAMMARVDSGAGAEIVPEAGHASEAGALGLRPALSQGLKTCEEDTWAYLDGKCVAGKKPRMVRVPTNRPAIATIPLGRAAAPVAGMAEPASAVAAAADGRKGDFSPSKPGQSAQAEPAVAAAATEPSQQPAAAPRKPQKTAHSQNRRRERDVRMNPAPVYGYASVRDQRYGQFGGGFFTFFR
jgi:hypothetical protein